MAKLSAGATRVVLDLVGEANHAQTLEELRGLLLSSLSGALNADRPWPWPRPRVPAPAPVCRPRRRRRSAAPRSRARARRSGQTTKIKLTLNATALKLLKRFKRLPATLALNGKPAGTVTFKPATKKKAKKRKH